MTTNHISLRREALADWPVFANIELPDHLEVISVEVRRRASQPLASAAASASSILRNALTNLQFDGVLNLIGIGRRIRLHSRVAAHNVRRAGLWLDMENRNVRLPEGERFEQEIVSSLEFLQFGGCIDVQFSNLATALEVTRRVNAICIGCVEGGGPSCKQLVDSLHQVGDFNSLLQSSISFLMDSRKFVARAYGKFDDAMAISEVFAQGGLIAQIERKLVEAFSSPETGSA